MAAANPFVRLLGPATLRAGGVEVAFTAERRFQLLALLAFHAGHWVSRDRIASLFWPDRPHGEARRNLRKVIFRLHGLPGIAELEVAEHALRWPVASDLADLVRACTDPSSPVPASAGQPLLDGLDDAANPAWSDWLAGERDRAFQLWRGTVLARVAQLTDPAEQATQAQQLLDADPLDEEALAALVRAEQARGTPAQGQRAFRVFAARLADELGVEPSAALRALAAAPDPHPAQKPPTNSPGSEFIGRRAELGEVSALLADPDCRLVTLLGPGGIGKSRLARVVVEHVAARFPGGAWWVEMQDLPDTAALNARIAAAAGITLDDRGDATAQLINALPTRPVLFALDNAEHLPDLRDWLDRLAGCGKPVQALVTSRTRIGATVEWLVPLRGLAVPDDESRDAEAAPSFDAVRLFALRAGQARRGFVLAEHLPGVLEIADLVDGMPLALELAAGWVRLLPPAEIARDLRSSIALLERDPAVTSVPARPEHNSLRTVLDRTWEMLAPRERDLLAAVSVFRGGFTRAAAQAVAEASMPLLSSLVDKSLLATDAAGRFSVHPIVAGDAARRLGEDPPREARASERHAAHYAAVLAALEPEAIGDQRLLVRGIQAEYANVREAWQWSLRQGRADLVGKLVRALWSFHENRGQLVEGCAMLEPALGLPPHAPGGVRTLTRVRHGLSMLLHRRGLQPEGLAVAEAGIAIGEHCGDNEAWIGCILNSGSCLWQLGQTGPALKHFKQALAIATARSDHHSVGWALGNVAVAEATAADYEAAGPHCREALAIMQALGDQYNVAVNLINLGSLGAAQQDWPTARDWMAEAVEHCARYGIGSVEGYAQLGLGRALRNLGELQGARRHALRAHDWSRDAGMAPVTWNASLVLARIDLDEGLPAAALARVRQVAAEAQRKAAASDLVGALLVYADWLAARGDRLAAERVWRVADAAPACTPSQRLRIADPRRQLGLTAAEQAEADGALLDLEGALRQLRSPHAGVDGPA